MEELQEEYKAFVKESNLHSLDFGVFWRPFRGMRPLVPSDVCMIMGPTSTGKTIVGQNIVKECNMPCLCFQLELSNVTMFERWAANVLGVSQERVEKLYQNDNGLGYKIGYLDHIDVAAASIHKVENIGKIIGDWQRAKGINYGIVWVDYIGLVDAGGGSRYERVSRAAETLKRIAKSLNVIMIETSQVVRHLDGQPEMSDGKDSGSLENSAQLVMSLWRPPDDGETLVIKPVKFNKGKLWSAVHFDFDGSTATITPKPLTTP